MVKPAPVNTAPAFTHRPLGHTGMVKVDFSGLQDQARSVALLPDGRIVVAGDVATGTGAIGVLRLEADGSLDASFDGDGQATFDNGAYSSSASSLAVQPDGMLVVAGAGGDGVSWTDKANFHVIRVDVDGRLDPGFDGDGRASFDFGQEWETAEGVVLQPDGKVVVAGYSYGVFAVLRLEADGTLDGSFGDAGQLRIDFGMAPDYGADLVLQSDGKILVAGFADDEDFSGSSFSLVRLESSGALDAGFGDGGRVSVRLGDGWDMAESVTLQPDGKILVAGVSESDFGLVRLDARGALDTSFGDGGKALFDIGVHSADIARRILVQPDGKIVVAGTNDGKLVLIRVDADGRLDEDFGERGKLGIDVGNTKGGVHDCSVALQPDGKLVLVGGDEDFTVIRVDADGQLDTSFGTVADGSTPPPSTLGGTVHYTEGAAVVLDADAAVFDAELGALDGGVGNYAGAVLRLSRAGGASAQDLFSAVGDLAFSGGQAVLDGVDVGTVQNADGTLRIAFNGHATQQRVDEVLRSIGYANASEAPQGSVVLSWRFQDGRGPDAQTVTDRSTVLLHNVNDAPTGGVSIAGPAVVGQQLHAESTLADADGLGTLSWQWLRGGRPIPGETGATYTVTEADAGRTLSVKAVYKDGGRSVESVVSAASAVVAYAPDRQSGDAGGLPVADVLRGGKGDSTLDGRAADDMLFGDTGRDTLSGGTGNDLLDGGKGDDALIGGAGADRLTGGEGRDTFRFTALSDLGLDEVRDRITDFARGQDRIDLSQIDADPGAEGDQAFTFVGRGSNSGWGEAPGQLRYAGGIVSINTDTDAAAEYQIELVGRVPAALSAADFVL